MNNTVLSLLGLARRAGKLTWQEEANLAAIRSGRARLVIIAGDTGQATVKMYQDKCRTFDVALASFATRGELGRAIGTSARAAVVVLDAGFANSITRALGESSDHL